MGDGDTNRRATSDMFEHPAGLGPMQQQRIVTAGMDRRDDKGLAVLDKANMADGRGVDDRINDFLVVLTPIGHPFDRVARGLFK